MGFKRSGRITVACMGLLLAASYSFSDFLIDDFNDENNKNNLDSYWYFYNDKDPGGNSVVNNDPFEENGCQDGAAYMDFSLGDSVEKTDYVLYPFVGMGFNFDGADGETDFDLTGATALKFRAKGDQEFTVKLLIETSNVTDDNKLHHKFKVAEAWDEVTVLLEDDPDLGLTQENWGSSSPKRKYDATKVLKLAFQVRGNENKKLKDGVLYIDDMELVGEPKIKAWGEMDTVKANSYTGKGLLADFEGEYPFENKIKGEWYPYTDEPNGTSAFTKGVDGEGNLAVSEDGGISGAGLSVSFLLGDKYEDEFSGDSVLPFCGVGCNFIRSGKAFDADAVGATGIYFEYKSNFPVILEVIDGVSRGGGEDYFVKLPSTGDKWAGAKVPFDSLKSPKWVTSPKPLALTNLSKFQFKLSDGAKKEGSISIDNIYLMDAELVGIKSRITNLASKGILVAQRNSSLNIQLDSRLGDSKISLINPMGKIVVNKSISANARTCSLPLLNNASGVYLLKISSANGQVETSPIHIIR